MFRIIIKFNLQKVSSEILLNMIYGANILSRSKYIIFLFFFIFISKYFRKEKGPWVNKLQ